MPTRHVAPRARLIAALGAALLLPVATPAQGAPLAPHAPLAATATTDATAARPEAVFTLLPHRTRWALDVEVGGKPFRFGLDTGGGVTIVSSEVAAAAGCTPWGRLTGFQMFGRRLDGLHCDSLPIDIAGHRVTPLVAGVTAPAEVEKNDTDLAGSLALDAFEGRAVTIDFAAGRLVVESPASLAERVKGMTPLHVRLVRELSGRALSVVTAVPSPRGTLWMELDSGNGGTMLVSRQHAAMFGLDSTANDPQRGSFELVPGVRVESDRFFTPDMIIDGNIGMPFLKGHVLTLDLATSRAWIAKGA